MKDINYAPVCFKLKELIQAKIKEEGLVATGKMLNSITVRATLNGGFEVDGEEYFLYLDDTYNLSEGSINTSEFIAFYTDFIAKQIENNI